MHFRRSLLVLSIRLIIPLLSPKLMVCLSYGPILGPSKCMYSLALSVIIKRCQSKLVSYSTFVCCICKFTVAVDKLPNFLAVPNIADGKPGPHHQCSIHLNCESLKILEAAYKEGQQGRPSSRLANQSMTALDLNF